MRIRWVVGAVVVLTVVVLGVGMVVFPSTSSADGRAFTDQTIRGSWGFSASGTTLPPAVPAPTEVVAVGVMKFDGKGGCTITDQVNFGGTAIPADGFRTSKSCAYQVNTDGTGTLTVSFESDPFPTPVTFVIVDKAREIQLIRTDLGVAIGVAKRQR